VLYLILSEMGGEKKQTKTNHARYFAHIMELGSAILTLPPPTVIAAGAS
jgi:hypothetical protein